VLGGIRGCLRVHFVWEPTHNVSVFCGIGGAFRACLGGVKGVLGVSRGVLGCILCGKRLKLS